ncbi:MAG: citrate/2-methylcitrate synthase [Thermoplasmatales archaeon]|nr:citrate/2-methylcitrate synthase [Thermoplasmatales archaeon]
MAKKWYDLFDVDTQSFVYGMQANAVQRMLDFDYVCGRKIPSVAAIINPSGRDGFHKAFFGGKEILVPVYKELKDAVKKHPEADVVVNFASFRSAYPTTMEALGYDSIKTVAVIAEGIPERRTKEIIAEAKKRKKTIIGPATVGGLKAGAFKIGNTGGMIDNIMESKLHRPGSVAYVSKSGGMSNELNNIIARNTDGVYEGIAIGGDRYPGSVFIDHILRYEANPEIKMIVLLGEVGGIDEYQVVEAIKSGKIKKPVVAWCIGTCAKMFKSEVQFGHAGALAGGELETADAKNKALKEAGAIVPDSFDEFDKKINETYNALVKKGVIKEKTEPEKPGMPMDYAWAVKMGMIRKPTNFISTISDDRGEELHYGDISITDVFKRNIGTGGVISQLWFKRQLPDYGHKFIEMVLQITADHGPAVSGAHNTIVAARAGKDLISSLVSGLLTIGPRFGGAIDGAAQMFSSAYDRGLTPSQFVDEQKKKGVNIQGIGHRVKSVQNPDMRVTLIKDYVKKHFKATPLLDYALEVEKLTTKKKNNLILNVDGCIGICFVDLLRSCGKFTREEADEYVSMGALNGLFVLGRSIGLMGHYLDQKRLKQGLYRHPWDDICYLTSSQ